jgi:hypothetical protein
MASMAVTRLADKAESARAALSRFRDKAKLNERRALSVGEIVAGSALGAVLDRKLDKGKGHWDVAGVPATPVLGLAMAVAGLSGWVPGAEDIAMLGVGLIAGPAYTYVYNKTAPASH